MRGGEGSDSGGAGGVAIAIEGRQVDGRGVVNASLPSKAIRYSSYMLEVSLKLSPRECPGETFLRSALA